MCVCVCVRARAKELLSQRLMSQRPATSPVCVLCVCWVGGMIEDEEKCEKRVRKAVCGCNV